MKTGEANILLSLLKATALVLLLSIWLNPETLPWLLWVKAHMPGHESWQTLLQLSLVGKVI